MTNGSDAIVEIAGLSIATLGGKRVIDDLSIEILAGENRALVGESGSGKTTLALALMGRIRSGLVHEAGTIFVDGANVLSLKGSSLRRYRAETVSWLSQDPALSLTPHMTVRALLSESVPMDDEDALGLLGRVGLSGVKGLLDRRPRSLSGGQRRRVAIAKAIASKPRVLILDEPTAGLDGATADEVVATIKGICAESGMSVVAITHDLDVAGKFAESVTVLKEGCVLETVSHSELMNNPGTDYARKLVDAQRLERRPGDEMDSSAGAPVFSASSFDVVTPDGKVATRNAAFSINHGRGLSLFGPRGRARVRLSGPSRESALRKEVLWRSIWAMGICMFSRARSRIGRKPSLPPCRWCRRILRQASIPRFAWTPSFLAPSGGCILAGRGKR